MEKFKLSIIGLSVIISCSLFANNNESSLYGEAKKEMSKEEENSISSKERSDLRNSEILTQLENKVLDSDIDKLNKQLAIKKLRFKLENVPAEYLDNVEDYYQKEYFTEKEVGVQYPVINESVNQRSNNKFPIETYAIDQQELIPKLKAMKKPKKVENQILVGDAIKDIKQEVNQVPTEVSKPVVPDLIKEVVKVESKPMETTNIDVEDIVGDVLSEAEKNKLNAILNSDSKPEDDIINTNEKDLVFLNEEIEQNSEYSEIKSAVIDSIFIFGEDKSVDLGINIYVGDGVDGEEYKDVLTNVKEGQIISVKGYNYKISRISFTEVEITNVDNDKTYVASKSLRSLEK